MGIRPVAVALPWLMLGGALCATSALGPPTGRPVLVPTGRVGDRALVVFAEPKELATFIHVTC
jgi:hypothetical protein